MCRHGAPRGWIRCGRCGTNSSENRGGAERSFQASAGRLGYQAIGKSWESSLGILGGVRPGWNRFSAPPNFASRNPRRGLHQSCCETRLSNCLGSSRCSFPRSWASTANLLLPCVAGFYVRLGFHLSSPVSPTPLFPALASRAIKSSLTFFRDQLLRLSWFSLPCSLHLQEKQSACHGADVGGPTRSGPCNCIRLLLMDPSTD